MEENKEKLTAKEALVLMASGHAVMLDVRKPEELQETFKVSHALNIPIDDLPSRMGELPKDKIIITFCRSGKRAQKAQELLKANGFNVKCVPEAGETIIEAQKQGK